MNALTGSKILLGPSTFAAQDPSPIERLAAAGCEIIKNPFGRKLTKQELIELLPGVKGLIAGLETLDEDVMRKSELKVISRCGSGISNIDMEAAKKKGIKVFFTPYGPTTAVAELTLGAMLNLLRMVSLMDRDMHEGKWTKKVGAQLEGKTVVVIGLGRIGRKVVSLLKPFNVRLLAVDPNVREKIDRVEILPLGKALTEADIITIHSSGEQQIIGDDEFRLIKRGTFLLNAARGGLINEIALINAIESGKIAGAWLDTFSVEPYAGPLSKYPQVLLTPHVGSYTQECRISMETEAVENLITAFEKIKQDEG
ncbi:MAG: phosphoglycerate dehydrogenase [Candidatus Brocadiaceae bacterium]|nr:phosphoglycerate dehydrogenase [Candidatus Brocadiaceae bacterium]